VGRGRRPVVRGGSGRLWCSRSGGVAVTEQLHDPKRVARTSQEGVAAADELDTAQDLVDGLSGLLEELDREEG